MMTASVSDIATGFSRALPIILKYEGGKVDDPQDPGGRTNQGVTQRVYDAYRVTKSAKMRDVYLMEDAERDEIYRRQYWNAVKGDTLPPGVDLAVFDGAVHSGSVQSIKWLQRSLGFQGGDVDGHLGTMTAAALMSADLDHDALIADICAERLAFLKRLKRWKRFGNGWTARVQGIESIAQAWASGSVGPNPNHVIVVAPEPIKAPPSDVKDTPVRAPGDIATGVGLGAGGLSQVVDGLKDQLAPYSAASTWVQNLVIGLIIVGAILTIGGLAWRVYAMIQKTKNERAVA